MRNTLKAALLGAVIAPLMITAALASDPNEFTLDPILPTPTTTTTTSGG